MADPFRLALIEAGPGSEDVAQVAVWPLAVPCTQFCPLEKLPTTSCKTAVFHFFAMPATPLRGSCWSLALHPSPCLAHSKKAA